MPTRPIPPQVVPRPPATQLCLGLVLGTREVGFALANRNRLARHGIWTLRKLTTQQGREARLRAELTKLLDRQPIKTVALASLDDSHEDDPVIVGFLSWLRDELRRRRIRLRTLNRDAVRDAVVGRRKATGRQLARTLAVRFPALYEHTIESELPARGELANVEADMVPYPTAKERYWARAFLALATALQALERTRDSRQSS